MSGQRPAPLAQVDPDGTCDTARAKTHMFVEPAIFCGDDRVLEMGRHRLRSHRPPELIAAPCKDGSILIQKRHRSSGAPVQQLVHRRQCRIVVSNHQPQCQSRDKAHAPRNPPDQSQNPADDPLKKPDDAATAFRRSTRRFFTWLGLTLGGFCLYRSIAPVSDQWSLAFR